MQEIKIDNSTSCYSVTVGSYRAHYNGYILKGEKHDLGIDPTLLHLKAWQGGAFPRYILLTRLDLTTIGAVHELAHQGYTGVILLHGSQLESAQQLLPHKLRFQSIQADTGVKVGSRFLKTFAVPVPPHVPSLGLYDPKSRMLFSSQLFSSFGESQEALKEHWPDEGFQTYEEKETGPWPWEFLPRLLPDFENLRTILPAAGAPFLLPEGKLSQWLEASQKTRQSPVPARGPSAAPLAKRLEERLCAVCPPEVRPKIQKILASGADKEPEKAWRVWMSALERILDNHGWLLFQPFFHALHKEWNLPSPAAYQRPDIRGKCFLPTWTLDRLAEGICADPDTATDRVTDLPNEDAFKSRCKSLLQTEGRANGGGVIMILPDRLKEINARYGRSGGDEALQSLTWILGGALKQDRLQLFKLNGPYFGLLLENKKLEEMEDLAGRLREAALNSKAFYEALTVSIGLATLAEAAEKEDNLSEILDKLIATGIGRTQLASRQGGNTVCSSSSARELKELSSPKVLLIEPDPAYGHFLKEYLDSRGYSVLLADTGLEGLELARANQPRAIICETMVPQLSGFRIREELHQDSRLNEIPFILLSHRKTEDFIQKAIQLKILFYLKKPASLMELEGLLQLLLAQGSRT